MNPESAIDSIDRQILSLLQEDARTSNAELARRVGLSAAPVYERVRKLERGGWIRGYHADLEPARLGGAFQVLVSVTLSAHQLQSIDEFRTAVESIPEVRECLHVTGNADFQLRIAVADTQAYEELLRGALCRLPGVQTLRSSVVLSTLKHGHGIPIPEASP